MMKRTYDVRLDAAFCRLFDQIMKSYSGTTLRQIQLSNRDLVLRKLANAPIL